MYVPYAGARVDNDKLHILPRVNRKAQTPTCPPGDRLRQRGRRVEAQRPYVLSPKPEARGVDVGKQPSLHLLPLLHVRQHHGAQQPSQVRPHTRRSLFSSLPPQTLWAHKPCVLRWSVSPSIQNAHDQRGPTRKILTPIAKRDCLLTAQRARTEHISVPSPLRRGRIHYPPGHCLPHS